MKMVELGKTGLKVSKTAIGTVPLQRLGFDESVRLLRECYEQGINFFDTSDNYGGSDEKVGAAFAGRDVVIATKVSTEKYDAAKASIENSLKALRVEAIALVQLHNPKQIDNGALEAVQEAKRKGYVRHIGFTTHDLKRAMAAAQSGLFDTIQYPLNFLSGEKESELISLCNSLGMGLIAMKPFAGGMITEPAYSFAYFRQRNVVPIYGIQRKSELDALIALENAPPNMEDETFRKQYEAERVRLAQQFCRGCDRCAGVCPAGIDVNYAGRIGDFFYRNPPSKYLKDDSWYNKMQYVKECTNCGKCVGVCPFGSDMRQPMKRSYEIFMQFWQRRKEYI